MSVGFGKTREGYWYCCSKCDWDVQEINLDLNTGKFVCINCKTEICEPIPESILSDKLGLQKEKLGVE